MTIKNARLKEIDILYSISTLLVIFGHSHPNDWSLFEGTFFYHCIVFIYTFHMPLFFFIAGILLANSKSVDNKPFSTFVKEKAVKLLTPYFIITLITMLPKAYLEYGNFGFLNCRFILQTFFSPRNNTWGHFWFLPVLFICYILFGGIRKLFSKIPYKFILYILFGCCIIFSFIALFHPINTDWFGLNDFFDFAFYIPFGMLLYFVHKKIRFSTPPFLPELVLILSLSASIGLYIFFYKYLFFRFVISVIMILCLLSFSKLLQNKLQKFFTYFSKNIFSIYIYSWPFQSFALIILERLNLRWQLSAPIMLVIGIAGPLMLITIYKHCKKLNCRFLDLILGIR